jgi:hypothetical protein
VATASSEHYMSTRYQPLSTLFADGEGRASFQNKLPYGETGAVRINDWRVLQME